MGGLPLLLLLLLGPDHFHCLLPPFRVEYPVHKAANQHHVVFGVAELGLLEVNADGLAPRVPG